jgi:hypothetical protein
LPQGRDGALRAILLNEPEQDREANDHADGDGFDYLPEIRGDGGRDEQDENEEVLELSKQHRPRRHPMHVAELVGSEREQTSARLGGVEPGGRRRHALAHLR